jgi:hypothetical protein
MMKKILLIGSIVVLGGLVITGCYNDNSEELYPKVPASNCDTANLSFSAKVAPIFNNSCALSGCHKTGSSLGGHILDTYEGVKAAANSGRLIGAINWLPNHSPMPKGGSKLSFCDILKIETWIKQGTPNN